MSISLALLVSADPPTVQQFSHALQELSISGKVCPEVPAAIRLLNQQKFDAVIVDLKLEGQSELVLDEVHLSVSNRTAVTFAISDTESTVALRKKSSFVFERPLSAQSIRNTPACLRTDFEGKQALFSMSNLHPRCTPKRSHASCSQLRHKRQRRWNGCEHTRSP